MGRDLLLVYGGGAALNRVVANLIGDVTYSVWTHSSQPGSLVAVSIPALSPIHAAFGDALRELRTERGISQEGLALQAGLNRGYYSGVERGRRNVSLTNIAKLSAALDLPTSAIHARAEQIAARRPSKRSPAP
jgi:DNA-binding XRE family transcriptional regulator